MTVNDSPLFRIIYVHNMPARDKPDVWVGAGLGTRMHSAPGRPNSVKVRRDVNMAIVHPRHKINEHKAAA